MPYIPGDVTNATTYDYPVLIKTYGNVDTAGVACGDPAQRETVVAAARDMEAQGVRGISGDCGFYDQLPGGRDPGRSMFR